MTDRETWLSQRRECITATDVSKILGLAPWGSPHSVWRDKHALEKDFPPTPAMRLGVEMEPRIVEDYVSRHTGVTLDDPGRFTLARHPDHPWIACTPDRIYTDRSRGLECKYAMGSQRYWSEDKPADHAFLQAHWSMIAMQIPRWDIAAWIGNRYYEYNLEADEELHGVLIEECRKFFDRYIVGDEEPPDDGQPETSAYLATRFPIITDEMLTPTEEVMETVYRYRDILAEEKALKAEKEKLKQKLARKIGDATGFCGDDFTLTYKPTKPSQKIHTSGLIAALEATMDHEAITDLVEAHTTETPGARRMNLRFQEENNG